MAPQNKGGEKIPKKTIEHYKGWFLNILNVPFIIFLAIKVPT
jgi:hypothetical protein